MARIDLRRMSRAAGVVLVALAGAWLALQLAGRIHHRVGPFEVEYFARPGRPVTEIALPPFGRVEASTHWAPVRLTATLVSVDPDRANALIQDGGVRRLVFQVEDRALSALRTYLLRAGLLALAGAVVAGLAVYRGRWRRTIAVGLAGLVLVGGSGGLAWATYSPAAFLEPTYTGSLGIASRLVGPIREATDRIEDFRAELDRLVRGAVQAYAGIAAQAAPSEEAVRVLHVSDIHGSPIGMDLAVRLASTFEIDAVIDTGDITSFGTPPEASVIDRISDLEVPYVFVRGNHDSPAIGARIAAIDNAVVLENEAAEVAGLRIHGAPHPLFTPNPETDDSPENVEEVLAATGGELARSVAAAGPTPDILAVHDDRMALALAGRVPLVVAGHFHRYAAATHDETLFLRVGSTGGGGIDTFVDPDPFPLSAEILYFDGDPLRLVAWDEITLDPETRELVARRRQAPEEPAPAEPVTPTPSPLP
jgi:predicted phosphodiesterase